MFCCPIRELVNTALRFVQQKDPSWDKYQPRSFRYKVVEAWKKNIQVNLWHGCCLCWSLQVGPQKFEIITGLFRPADRRYNPYQ